jgi:hypothetical protein
MRGLRGITIAGALLGISLLTAPSGMAATEVGSNCAGSATSSDNTLLQLAVAPGSSLPITAPAGGVVTRWRVNSNNPAPLVETFRVFRSTAVPNQFRVVGESPIQIVVKGLNSFNAQIPIQAGDRFGLYAASPSGALYCITADPANVLGYFIGDATLGSTKTFGEEKKYVAAVSAIVEPDADGDGYGDETQDKCPQSAQIQEACPPLTLSLYSIAHRSSALVLVSASVPSKIKVSARVPGAPPKKKRAGASATIKLNPVTHLANPGQITKYKLKFPGPLKAALANLPSSRSLALKVKASGANLAGLVRSEERTLRLKGQG